MAVVGELDTVNTLLERIQQEWKCSSPEFVVEGAYVKFCGFELTKRGDQFLLSQQSYAQDLLDRHPGVACRSTPFPGVLDEEPEDEVRIQDVRAAQGIVGELLWLSCRTRPDFSYGVSWMGRMVTKAPRRVCQYGEHMLGYLKTTVSMALHYGSCEPGQRGESELAFPRSMLRLEVHSDASFGPAGGRGHQGLIAMYGGCPIQWESKQQAFGTLSTSESELLGYTDAMVLGESVTSVLDILEGNKLSEEGDKVLYGDNQSGLRLLESPDGPWRTRHLRLRSFVLRERMKWGFWRGRHVPGAELASDLLTKAVTANATWKKFYGFMNMFLVENEPAAASGISPKVACVVVGTIAALGAVASQPNVTKMAKTASVVGLAALTAWLARKMGLGGHKNTAKKDPNKIQSKETLGHLAAVAELGAARNPVEKRCQRENEPWPTRDGVREHEPAPDPGVKEHELTSVYSSLRGSPNARLGRGSKAMDGGKLPVAERPDSRRHSGTTGRLVGVAREPSGGQLQRLDISNTSAQCSAGHPASFVASATSAMAGEMPRLAAMRFQREEIAYNFWPLNEDQFAMPPRGADRWTQLGNEWWVRSHGQWRTKTFHPIHTNMPFNASELHPVRFTLMFWDNGQEWAHRFVQDRWCDPPRALRGGVSGQWKGYTFVRLQQPGQPPSAASSWGDGEPTQRVHPGPEIQRAEGVAVTAAGRGPGSKGGRPGKGVADCGRIVASDMLQRRPPYPGIPGGAAHENLGPSGVYAGGDQRGRGRNGPVSISSYSEVPELSESESRENDPPVNAQPVVQPLPAVDHQRLAEAIVAQMQQEHPAGNIPWPRAAEEPPLNGVRHHHQQMSSRVIGGYYTVRTPTPSDDEMPMPGEAIDRLLHGRFDGADGGPATGQLGQVDSGTGSFDLVEDEVNWEPGLFPCGAECTRGSVMTEFPLHFL